MNIKLAAFVALLGVGFYYCGTCTIIPSIFLLIGFILSPFSNKTNYVSSFAARAAKPNHTAPYRKYKDKLISQPKGVNTLYENFQMGRKIAGDDAPCLGSRSGDNQPYFWETYEQVDEKIRSFGSGLLEIGIERGDRIGFYAKNRVEWFIGAESCNAYSFVSVAIYDTLGEENREFIVQQSAVRAILTTNNLLGYVCELARTCHNLKHAVIMGKVSEEERKHGKAAGITVHSFDELIEIGRRNLRQPSPPNPDDLAILMYTSGTTSRPKGVMISNRNVIAVVAGVYDAIPDHQKDCYLSYLPLAHILERAAEAYIISRGGKIGFFSGDLRKLTDDIKALQPTVYAGVPKVFQRIMNEVKKQIHDAGAIARVLFSICYALKRKFRLVGLPTGIFDLLIFNKTKGGLGGKVSVIVSGGAPLPQECHEFLSICFGTTIQGYGLTETCGGATITPVDYVTPWERAGAPISCCEIKLVSSGKYSTSSNPPKGELCVKGDNITHGYYEMPDKTKADFVVEEDGERWFHTGDVAQRNSDGTFSIIGRVKDIFKLDGGEYIAPERLESIYAQSKFLSNIFVWGDSNKSFIVAIVVPEFNAAARWAKENGVAFPENAHPPNCPAELTQNENFKKAIVADLKRIASEAKLNRYEEIPFIALDGLFWVPDTGLVTDALKNKRDPLYDHYSKQIIELYAKNHL